MASLFISPQPSIFLYNEVHHPCCFNFMTGNRYMQSKALQNKGQMEISTSFNWNQEFSQGKNESPNSNNFTVIEYNGYIKGDPNAHFQPLSTTEQQIMLSDFVKRVQFGKPAGANWDPAIELIIDRIKNLAKSHNSETLQNLVKLCFEEWPIFKEDKVSRGRLVWKILREGPNIRLPIKETIWSATQVAWYISTNYDTPAYIWSVMIDALNKARFASEADNVFEVAIDLSEKDERYSDDLILLYAAKLNGIIEGFQYDRVPDIINEMIKKCGQLTGWALNRALCRSCIMHMYYIRNLPYWESWGRQKERLPISLEHYVIELANIGLVARARECWIREYTQQFGENPSLNVSHAEVQYLILGIQLFGRAPHLEKPHDQILKTLLNRVEILIKANKQEISHLYGLVHHLCRSRLFDHAGWLANSLIQNGGTVSNSASPFPYYFALVGNKAKFNYWMTIRGPPINDHIRVFDTHNKLLLLAHEASIEKIFSSVKMHVFDLPLQYVANLQYIIYHRIDSSENGVTELEYREFIEKIVKMKQRFTRIDIHSQQKILLDLIIPGYYQDAEDFVFSPIRVIPYKNDILMPYIAIYYAHVNMIDSLIKCLDAIQSHGHHLPTLFGRRKITMLFEAVHTKSAIILIIWNYFRSAEAARSDSFKIVIEAAIKRNRPDSIVDIWRYLRMDNIQHMKQFNLFGPVEMASTFLEPYARYRNTFIEMKGALMASKTWEKIDTSNDINIDRKPSVEK